VIPSGYEGSVTAEMMKKRDLFSCGLILAMALTGCSRQTGRSIESIEDVRRLKATVEFELETAGARMAVEAFPGCKFVDFINPVDLVLALEAGKADAMVFDMPYLDYIASNRRDFKVLDGCLGTNCISIITRLGNDVLMDKVNEFIRKIRADGTYQEIYDRWITETNPKMPDIPEPEHPAGTLKVGVTPYYEPLCYVGQGGEYLGYDVEISRRLAQFVNCKVEFVGMQYDTVLAATVSRKIDLAVAQFDATPEHREAVLMSDPYIDCLIGVMVYDGSAANKSMWSRLVGGLYSTFVKEDRWKLFVGGFGVTLKITFWATVIGTLLSFLVWILLASRHWPLRMLGRGWVEMMQGLPILVLLMVVFYVVLADYAASAILVSIVVFGCNLSAYVGELIKSSVETVPIGQREAALALGYSPIRAFWRFIFPQALRPALPVYRGFIINVLKDTSVVGYITVQDITKISDIIRARTFDAFVPMVSTAIVYFVTAKLLAWGLERLNRRVCRVKAK